MWISKVVFAMFEEWKGAAAEATHAVRGLSVENSMLREENARLRADMDWFKLRLNQVERERGQLIQAAIGVKIAVPEFVPTYENPETALNEMPDLRSVGGDALDQGAPVTDADPAEGVDFSLMPGYRGK